MGYSFWGVFVERPAKGEKELEEIFEGYVREIQTPFVGAVVSFRGENELEFGNVKLFVLDESKQLPESTVAYIYYDTFGGALDMVQGFACRNGHVLEGSERSTEDDSEEVPDQPALERVGADILISLLESVGAKNPSFNFPPFERGFFPNT